MNKMIYSVLFLSITFLARAEKFNVISTEEIQNKIEQTISNKGVGNFINFSSKTESDLHFVQLGGVEGFRQYSASFRNKSCWMIPSIGKHIKDIPAETQFLLIDRGNSEYLMFIPLVDDKTRCSIGGVDTGLELIAETGDTLTRVNEFLGLYMLAGNNPYSMIKQASVDIQNELKSFKLRTEKNDPWFADHFGWCTWNAMFVDVGTDTLTNAMKHFKENDIPVKYIILDNGWLENKNGKLSSFKADPEKFPSGLAPLITDLKENYGLEKMIIWQAHWGKFGGLNKGSFPELEIETQVVPVKRFVENTKHIKENGTSEEIATMGNVFYPGTTAKDIVIPDFVPYYDQYFDYIRRQGADGVKIDAMTWVESVGQGRGGRVARMKDMMQGLQSAANNHFNNEMINCSSLSNDYLFNTLTSNVTRTSGDFFPEKPETHGAHIFINAHVSFWLGQFVLPDWDMFQSGHEAGDFHAAARAISGGPVYTTEVIGAENKEILKKLMTKNGRLPRCNNHGQICLESLFTNIDDKEKAIKVFNTNIVGGIVGAFNCSYDKNDNVVVKENVKPSDIAGFNFGDYVTYCYSDKSLSVKDAQEKQEVNLGELEFDLFTYVPVDNGFAPIGMVEKYNPGGMITEYKQLSSNVVTMAFLDGGKFLAYSERKPKQIVTNSENLNFTYKDKKLLVNVPEIEDVQVTIVY